jgi:O-antigen/teichoic acid export membrane protein
LNDRPEAQYQGFITAQRILAMVGVSSCLLQAATASPLTYLLLAKKWIPSIGVMQILCAGMALRMVAGSSYALLKSQGRFRAILWNRWLLVIMQVVGLWAVLSQGGGILSVALVVGLVSTIIGPISFYIAIRPYGAGWREIGKAVFLPAFCGIASIGAAWLIALCMDARGIGAMLQLIETVLVGVALNLLLAWLLMRPVWDDFWRRAWQLVPQWTLVKKAAAP